MSRALIVLAFPSDKEKAKRWIDQAKPNTRVEFREPKRTVPQSDRMWALLTIIASKRPFHNGVKMTPDLYKAVFMQALGVETVFLPTLDGDGVFPIGFRSSELSRSEMSGLQELIEAFAARENIDLGS